MTILGTDPFTKEDFVFVAKEQQRMRVLWPHAAKCYSLSPRERAGVRGKCTQYFHTRRSFCASFPLPMNLVAADVRRLHLFREIGQSLTSAATVEGFKARNFSGNSHP